MRLTCPNCSAQYEVPADVIPTDGRDVQCSNCGHTWFEPHPDHQVQAAAPSEPDPAVQEAPQEPAADPAPPEEQTNAPKRRELDRSVADILREEAEREVKLRAKEEQGLDIQTDLGLDNHPPDESERRAQQARDRMARIKGDADSAAQSDVQDPNDPLAGPDDGTSRRELLPDIEEISSTLKSADEPGSSAQNAADIDAPHSHRKGGGFTRGFGIALLISILLALLYVNAPAIARSVPQADPAISAYVANVDQARFWLESKLGQYLPR